MISWFVSAVICAAAVLFPRASSDGVVALEPGEPRADAPATAQQIDLDMEIGRGAARFVVKLMPLSEGGKLVLVRGRGGTTVSIPADGQEHAIRVPVSFPEAVEVTVDGQTVLAAFKVREPVYFLSDTNVGWAVVSARTDPLMDKGPAVLCKGIEEVCPGGYVKAWDPPLFRDPRCTQPRPSSKTAKLCYRPGVVSFESDAAQVVELVDWILEEQKVRRTISLQPGEPSELIPIPYETTRPVGVRVAGRDYFLAVPHGKTWDVRVGAGGRLSARERIGP